MSLLEEFYDHNNGKIGGNSLLMLVASLKQEERKLTELRGKASQHMSIENTTSGLVPVINDGPEVQQYLAEIKAHEERISKLRGKVNRINNLIQNAGEIVPDLQIYVQKIAGMRHIMERLQFKINTLEYHLNSDPRLPRREAHERELEEWIEQLYEMHEKNDPEIEKLEQLIKNINEILAEDGGIQPASIPYDPGILEEHAAERITPLPRVGPVQFDGEY